MDRGQAYNVVRTLDCIQFIKENSELIKPSEKEIRNPLDLARLLIRRKVKEFFPSFYIRKNQNNYSLRCDDEELYEILYLCKHIYSNNSFRNKLSEDIQREVGEQLDSISAIVFTRNHNSPIEYKFRDEERFFLYVSFLPQLEYISSVPDRETFERNSLKERIIKMQRLSESLGSFETNELFDKLLIISRENRVYSIYGIDGFITKNFLDFYCDFEPQVEHGFSSRRGHIREIYRIYTRGLEENATSIPSLNEVEEVNNLTEVTTEEDFTFSLVRSGRVVEESISDNNNIFVDTLQRVIARRSEESEDTDEVIEESNFELLELFQETVSRPERPEDEFDPEFGYFITENALSLYLRHMQKKERILKVTSENIYDDSDEDKDGLYFTVENSDLLYFVFKDSKVLLKTCDLSLAKATFSKIFNTKSLDIKYFNNSSINNFALAKERIISRAKILNIRNIEDEDTFITDFDDDEGDEEIPF